MKTHFSLTSLIRPNVLTMEAYSSARDEFSESNSNMIFLDANENPFDTGVNRYPDPQQTNLKAILAKNKDVLPSQLLLGNGSDEVLDLLFRAFCIPGVDTIISTPPTYGMYEVLANLNDIKNKKVVLNDAFQLQVSSILEAIDENTKMIFLCSPNNPTGNLLDQAAVVTLLENFKGLVVIDEAYVDFASAVSWTTKLDTYPNLVVTQTLSKAYAMAGLRLGICMASKQIIDVLSKIKPPYNINQLSQEKAIVMLSRKKLFKNRINLILNEKERIIEVLLKLNFVVKIHPSQTNFILLQVDDATKRYNQLLAAGIVIRNRSKQPLCENCLRITIGTPQENKRLVETLKTI